MRVFSTSDLHYGATPQGDAATRALAAHVVAAGRPDDVLILVGDHAVTDEGIVACLKLFSGFPGERLAVAGNHDVWVHSGESRDSWDRYAGLSTVYRRAGFRSLEDGPVVVGDTAFVGSMGWYDYSFGEFSERFTAEAYRSKVYPGDPERVWLDAAYVRWRHTDAEMTAHLAGRLNGHLAAIGRARELVVAIHHVPTMELLFHPRFLVPDEWKFLSGFLGSEVFSQVIDCHAEVPTLVVNGHVHRAKSVRRGLARYVSLGGDYGHKELLIKEGEKLVKMTFPGQ